jgi:hypothetical protein
VAVYTLNFEPGELNLENKFTEEEEKQIKEIAREFYKEFGVETYFLDGSCAYEKLYRCRHHRR